MMTIATFPLEGNESLRVSLDAGCVEIRRYSGAGACDDGVSFDSLHNIRVLRDALSLAVSMIEAVERPSV